LIVWREFSHICCCFQGIIELDRVWFVNKNFGCTWRLVQAMVVSRPGRLDSFAFQTDDMDADTADAPAAAVPSFLLDDNDSAGDF
jgi:hypothetical protein